EVPRKPLELSLTSEQKKQMIRIFIEDADYLIEQLSSKEENVQYAMFLTEPHPVDVEARKRVCLDIIDKYCKGYKVLIKPHPRDLIDYESLCPDAEVIKGRFPVEVLNFFEGLHIKLAVSVITTAMNNMDFVEEKLNLGASFWDAYEDPAKHAFNKAAGLELADK
ncbi:MAG: lipooligosaccharide sialyltransferase, partial [Lachnospiraceae bacterium]|nr:lipooligosaccharide sialyltransferase [Lachnospiraceae bacterium]